MDVMGCSHPHYVTDRATDDVSGGRRKSETQDETVTFSGAVTSVGTWDTANSREPAPLFHARTWQQLNWLIGWQTAGASMLVVRFFRGRHCENIENFSLIFLFYETLALSQFHVFLKQTTILVKKNLQLKWIQVLKIETFNLEQLDALGYKKNDDDVQWILKDVEVRRRIQLVAHLCVVTKLLSFGPFQLALFSASVSLEEKKRVGKVLTFHVASVESNR